MIIRRLCGVLRVRGVIDLLLVLLLGFGFVALPVFALLPSLWGFAAAAAVTYVVDEVLHVRAPSFVRRLAVLHLDRTMRFAVRTVMLLALASRVDAPDVVLVTALAVFSGHFALMMLYTAVHHAIRRRRVLPLVVRNLDLSELSIPRQPPALLDRRHLRKLLHLDLPAQAGLLAALAAGTWEPAYAAFALRRCDRGGCPRAAGPVPQDAPDARTGRRVRRGQPPTGGIPAAGGALLQLRGRLS